MPKNTTPFTDPFSLESLGGDSLPATTTEPSIAKDKLASDAQKSASPVEAPEAHTLEEIGVSVAEISELAKQDLDFFAALLMPNVFKYCYPPVFKSVWSWLLGFTGKKRVFPQLALGLPRGFGKTTFIKIYIAYCILFTDKKFILVVASTAGMAENIISDVADMLDEPNIRAAFGDWRVGLEKDTQSVKKFGYRGRNIILAGLGEGGTVRGFNLKNERPDVMVFEDIQSKECADSQILSNKLEVWMVGTAMKAKAPESCVFLFVGNMYPTKNSILRKLKANPNWVKFIVGGILADGSSLWQELQPIDQLMAEFENDLSMGHPELFYSEVLNDETASANNLVDISNLPDLPCQDGDISAGNFIIIDPATDKMGADEVSVGYFEVHDAYPVLMEVTEGRLSPGDTIRVALDYALTKSCSLIVVEGNAYQYSLLYWFDFICAQLNISGVVAVPIYSGIRSKNARILELLKGYAEGEIFVHEDARPAAHTQMLGFNPLRRDNTDGVLDLLTYAPKVIELYGEYLLANTVVGVQEYEATELVLNNSPF